MKTNTFERKTTQTFFRTSGERHYRLLQNTYTRAHLKNVSFSKPGNFSPIYYVRDISEWKSNVLRRNHHINAGGRR